MALRREATTAGALTAEQRLALRWGESPGLEQDEDGVWTAPGGSLIAWFRDPDANTLSLQQAPRD